MFMAKYIHDHLLSCRCQFMTMDVQKVELWIIPSKFRQNPLKKVAVDIDGLKT